MAQQGADSDCVADHYRERTVDSWDRAGDMAMHVTALEIGHWEVCHRATCQGVPHQAVNHEAAEHLDQRFQLSFARVANHQHCVVETWPWKRRL